MITVLKIISRAHISDYWNHRGYPEVPKLPFGSLGGGPVRSLGAKALPTNHGVLHLCTNTSDETEFVVVFRNHFYIGSICCDI